MPKKAAYVKFPNPASRFALVGVFVAQTGGGVRVAVTGAAPAVFRSKPLEDALGRAFTADAAKGVKIDAKGLNADLHGSPEYRAHLIAVLAVARGGRRRLSRPRFCYAVGWRDRRRPPDFFAR